MSFKSFRERVNLFLYDSKEKMLSRLRILSLLISLGAIGTLVYYYGYPQTEESAAWSIGFVKASFGFYVIRYFIRILYDFAPKAFLRRTWFEAVMVGLLIVEGISYNFFDGLLLQELFVRLGVRGFADFSNLFIQIYFLLIVFVGISRESGSFLPRIKLHPAMIFILSFVLIIMVGTGLLMLPEMTVNGISFLDALFTSTSATCVTGLMTEGISNFTFKGEVVLLILIKIGGLNIIAFGSFLALASRFGLGVKHHSVIEDFVNRDSVVSARGMLGRIIIWSTLIEIVGACLLFVLWLDEVPFASTGDKVFSSVFHSVSAFNNAGISLFENGLFSDVVKDNFLVHLVLAVLIFFGALGFNSIFDLFTIRRLRERLRHPWKQISFSTKIALYFSLILLVIGTVLYFFLEQDKTLDGQGGPGSIITSLFQIVNRTSGFASVDYHDMGVPMLVFIMFLMFVGASSSSTGGGIKTSTFAIIWASTMATVRGHKHVQLFKRSISHDLILRAFAVLLFFIFGNLVGIFLLAITEGHILAMPDRGIIDLMFEEVSALGTVGLSTGITSDLSEAGRVIIIISMFVGRVGTLTVAYALGRSVISNKYKYPSGHTMVG